MRSVNPQLLSLNPLRDNSFNRSPPISTALSFINSVGAASPLAIPLAQQLLTPIFLSTN